MKTKLQRTPFVQVIGKKGMGFLDGDWILSEDMSDDREIGIVQLKHIGNGEFVSKEFKFITKDKSLELGCTQLEEGDLLVSRMADPIGRSCILPKLDFPTVTAVDVTIIRPDPNVANTKYLNYILNTKTLQTQAKKYSVGTTRERISRRNLEKLLIPLPSIESQKNIVAVLDRVNQLKKWRREANQLTNDYVNSVFLKMFGDKFPKNKIGDIAEFVSSGSTPLGGEATYLPAGITFIRSQNVHMNELELKDVAHISEDTHRQMRRTWVKHEDVLLNITGASLGRVAVYEGESDRANVNQHVCIIRVNSKRALPQYVAHYLSMPNAQKEIWTVQAGASRQALNFKQVRGLKLYLPDMEEQRKFACFAGSINRTRKKQDESSREISDMFDSLICRVVKDGKIC